MPSAEHSKIVYAPLPLVWTFVRDIENWAPLVTGYQRHETLSESESFWFLKGELGGLTRIAEFKVHIDEWDEAGHVTFSLKGINEPVTGSGSFHAAALAPACNDSEALKPAAAPSPGFLSRWCDAIIRRLFAKIFGRSKTPATPPALPVGNAQAQITFKLTLTATGMAGMVMNALLTPMMRPVAEDLADKIAAAIEARQVHA